MSRILVELAGLLPKGLPERAPAVSAINGAATAGGLTLSLCTLRVMMSSTRLRRISPAPVTASFHWVGRCVLNVLPPLHGDFGLACTVSGIVSPSSECSFMLPPRPRKAGQ
jgi:hypothetical protein